MDPNDLFAQWQTWATNLSRKAKWGADQNDRTQEALLALWEAALAFGDDPTASPDQFQDFARPRILRRLNLQADHEAVYKRRNFSVGLKPEPNEHAPAAEEIATAKETVRTTSKRNDAILQRYAAGERAEDIAHAYGLRPSQVWSILQKAKTNMKGQP